MTTPHQAAVEIVAHLYGITEQQAKTQHPAEIDAWLRSFMRIECPDCAGSGANQNGSEWDCCDTCKGRRTP